MPIDNQLPYPPIADDSLPAPEISQGQPVPAPVSFNNPPWGLAGALLVWLLSLVLLAFVPLIFLIPLAVQRGLDFKSPEFIRVFAELATSDKMAILLQVISLLPTHLLTFALVWALVTRFGKYPFLRTIGWEWPDRVWPWLSVGLGVVLFGVAVAVTKLIGADKPTQLEQIINSSAASRFAIAFLAVFTAPFVEEFVYRGVLFSALQKLAGSVLASFVTLGLFTLIHVPQYWPNIGVLAAVGLLSVALTIVRAKTGTLLPCIVIHFVFNGIQSVLLLFEPYFSTPPTVPDPLPSLVLLLRLGLF